MKKQNKSNRKKKNGNKRNPRGQSMTTPYGTRIFKYAPWGSWDRYDLEYVQTFIPAIGAGATYEQIFRANSLFDPDASGAGTQPRGFDQITPLYNRYRVNRLRWRVEFAATTVAYVCVAGTVNGSQTFGNITDAAEVLHVPIKIISNGAPAVVFQGQSQLDQLNGRSFLSYHTDDLTQAVATASPTEVINFHVVASNLTLVAIAPIIVVSLWYDTIFFDPIIPGPS